MTPNLLAGRLCFDPLPFHSPLIRSQSHFRGRLPVERLCSLNTLRAQYRTIFRIIYYLGEGCNQGLSVERIKQQTRIADNFGETGSISRNHWYSALHGFDYRQAKAFKIGWVHETNRAAIKTGQVSLRNITCKNDRVAEGAPLSRAKGLAIKPTTFSCQDKLGK